MSFFFGELQRYVVDIIAGGPKFLGQRNILRFLESTAVMLDGDLEALRQGMLLTRPLDCDASALPIISRDRNIKLYPSEPIASQRYRLSRWLQLHRQRGTHQGEMRNVQPYFSAGVIPRIRIVHQDGNGDRATWHTLDPDGTYSVYKKEPSNWDFDGHPELWSRWWAIIYSSGVGVLEDRITHWGDGSVWDGGQVWDGAAAQVFADIVAMLVDWKAAHSRCAGVILARDPDSFDPTATSVTNADGTTTLPVGNWGHIVDPATGLPTRPQTATWLLDRYYQ